MRILVAPDSFKGSLDAPAAAAALTVGLRRVWPEATIDACPLSDGGEGFLASLGGELETYATTTALGAPIEAAVLRRGDTLVVELSAAAGLLQVAEALRDPRITTTYGVGTLIAAAYTQQPFKKLLLALGGSATVDGGTGLLSALGVRFLDEAGKPLAPGGQDLIRLARIDTSALSPALAEVTLAVDVENPLLGPRGAATVFGPQKGADAAGVTALEAALTRYAEVLEATTGVRTQARPGAGAAGGVPAGLVAIAGARCVPGFEVASEAVGLDARLVGCDLVVTGEGTLDLTSFEGKVVGRLAARCQAAGVPLLVVAGRIAWAPADLLVVALAPGAFAHAAALVADAAARGAKLYSESLPG